MKCLLTKKSFSIFGDLRSWLIGSDWDEKYIVVYFLCIHFQWERKKKEQQVIITCRVYLDLSNWYLPIGFKVEPKTFEVGFFCFGIEFTKEET